MPIGRARGRRGSSPAVHKARRWIPFVVAALIGGGIVLLVRQLETPSAPAEVNQDAEAGRILQTVRVSAQQRAAALPVVRSPQTDAHVPRFATASPPSSAGTMHALITRLVQQSGAFWAQEFKAAGLPYAGPVVTILDRGQTAASPSCRDEMNHKDTLAGNPNENVEYNPGFFCPKVPSGSTEPSVFFSASWIEDQAAGIPSNVDKDLFALYVVGHEIGHHSQHQLGIAVDALPSIQLELSADCLSGVFASSVYPKASLGPDEIGRAQIQGLIEHAQAGSHGTLFQRVAAFQIGYTTGAAARCYGVG